MVKFVTAVARLVCPDLQKALNFIALPNQEGSRFRLVWREYPRDRAARYRARLNTNVIPVAVNSTPEYITNPGYPGYEDNLAMVWDLQSPPLTRIQVRIVT